MKSEKDILEILQRVSDDTSKRIKLESDKLSERLATVAEDTSAMVQKASEDVSVRMARATEGLGERLAKVAEDTSAMVQKASEDVSVRMARATEGLGERLQDTVEKQDVFVKPTVEETAAPPIPGTQTLDGSLPQTAEKYDMSVIPEIKESGAERFHAIYSALSHLNKDDQLLLKPLFLKAVLTKNEGLFCEVMGRLKLTVDQSDLQLCNMDDKRSSAIFTSDTLGYIQHELAREPANLLLPLLMKTFQSIPELAPDKTAIGISMRDKKTLALAFLHDVEREAAQSVISQLTDLSFDPVLPAFRPSLGDANYTKHRLSKKLYLAAISYATNLKDIDILSNAADISHFIILTIAFLQSRKDCDKDLLQAISADYLFVDYESCIGRIRKYFLAQSEMGDEAQFQVEDCRLILACIDKLKDVNPANNDPRRFFETRLAQYINGITHSEETIEAITPLKEPFYDDSMLHKETLDAANKILCFFLGEDGVVTNPLEMEQKISQFANGYKDTSKFQTSEIEFINTLREKLCVVYKGRDRIPKPGETGILERKFETSPDKVGADTWNSAGGVMKGTSPTFRDAEKGPVRNMLVDTSSPASQDTGKFQWFRSNNRHRSAYVGSISGHTCNIVGMLNKYMAAREGDPGLERDLTLFLVQLVAVYAKRGYHAMLEVMDVLHDVEVQKVFLSHGVKLDLQTYFSKNQECQAFFEYAFNDAGMYTEQLLAKRILKVALLHHGLFQPKPADNTNTSPGEEDEVVSVEKKV
ncbi:Dot/Icm T4SS effector Ceg14/sidL [Legionella spiritensis]|uniref:Dot/Icm T4SS effector Ceg14/sidL n=1 Tax=Legionella spiritensis TaxID=452 RepID=UPI000F6FB161|nr:Dot/Icm T4SS effector Ceg14/sidL [Legionella spiritensis]VEG90886.1 Dot/Icm secretion system substrate [Legionella spiritensis]